MSSDVRPLLDALRRRVDAALRDALGRASSDPGFPPRLRDAMAHSLFAPGKRLRPALVLLACEACGGDAAAALPAACAAEMVHTYSLVHDDLPAMDDDDLRRGLPTCHVVYGEALAILAGDALLTLAFESLADAPAAAACCRELARGAGPAGMVGGQAGDLAAEGRSDVTFAELESIHARKTGALFRACLRIGGLCAGAGPEAVAALDAYGRAFGQAFQITDDLLDVESSAEAAGKRTGKDAARGKLTYPALLGVEESRRLAREQVRAAVEAVRPFGPAGEPLAGLARLLLERDR